MLVATGAEDDVVQPIRPLPLVDDYSRGFWTGGAAGELRIFRCHACSYFVHPPAPVCPNCVGRSITAEPVSGRGEVYSFTVNRQPWLPTLPPPYVIALVELEEQAALRVLSNIVGCETDEVHIGLLVEATFIAQDDVYVPVFRPRSGPQRRSAQP
jgi:uncharacterized OB-fold protein